MKLINQILQLTLIGLISLGCVGQSNSKQNDSLHENSLKDAPPEIPENLIKQDRIAKQIYKLQRELRDLRIEEFVEDVKQNCEFQDSIEIEFNLDQESGELIQYLIEGNDVEIDCIQDRLKRIQRNFGEMSFGFTNAFRMRPTSKFIITTSKIKK